jgi:DNA-directed RNA polymerase subunit RPC12/RpoP
MFLAVIVLASLVGAGVAGYWLTTKRQPVKEPVNLYRCSHCGQKLRYLASKAGNAGMCPRCRNRFVFPENSQEITGDALPVDRISLARSGGGRYHAIRR